MVRCTNCDYKWKARDVLAAGFSKNGRECSSCGERQYISAETQRMLTLGYISIIFLPLLPFLIQLSNKKEEMFD
ncbi:hypothetical protein VBD025_14575 [Virgibacillus flavescens]|uniref:hypothetical protein n=1 Tax=Virgibacillus flavescens TaxID=1611422 RepID=UPI003D356C0F